MSVAFLDCSSPCFCDTASFINLKLIDSARLADQQALGIHLPMVRATEASQYTRFFHGC